MRPGYGSEARRTALSWLALGLAAGLALVGGLALLAGPGGVSPPSIATVYYYSDDAYHLVAYVHDSAGGPIGGLAVQYSSPTGLPEGAPAGGTTSASGIVAAAFPGPPTNETYTITATTAGGTNAIATPMTAPPATDPPGTVLPGVGDLADVDRGTYASTGQLMAFFAGPNGTAAGGFRVQFIFTQFDLLDRPAGPEAAGSIPDVAIPTINYSIARFSGYSLVAPVHVPPPPIRGLGPDITVQIVNPAGHVVDDGGFPPAEFGPQSSAPAGARAAEQALTDLGVAALVAGLLAGLVLYGVERLSGTLEPELARPVSPGGFLVARYAGALAALAAGTLVGVVALDLGLWARFGAPMPPALLAIALASCLAAVASWLAVPFALAHFLKSPQRLTSAVLAVLIVFGFLWGPAIAALGPLAGLGPGTIGAAKLAFDADVLNPALAPATLAQVGLLGTGAITAVGILVAEVLWVGVPLRVAVHRARTAD